MASAVRVRPEQLPAVWSSWEEVAATLDLPGSHDVYVTQFPVANAAAIGSGKPMVVVNSAAISLFDEPELQTVLAHEAGHILSDHVLYRTALLILLQLAALGRVPTLAGLPTVAIRSALLEWSRAAELRRPRRNTRQPRSSCHLANTARARQWPLVEAAQRQRVSPPGPGLPRVGLGLGPHRAWSPRAEPDPLPSCPAGRGVDGVGALRRLRPDRRWQLRKRQEKADPAAEAEEAFRHYRGRFQRIFHETGESLGKVPDLMADWLQQIKD